MILNIVITVFAFILILLGWIVFVPVKFYLDTETNQYEVFQQGTFSAALHWKDKLQMTIKFFGITVPMTSHNDSLKAKAKRRTAGDKRLSNKSPQAWWFLIKGVVRSFSAKKVVLDFDTDNFVTNAQLIPLAMMLRNNGIDISTNFSGRVYAHMEVEAYPYKMLWVLLEFLTIKK